MCYLPIKIEITKALCVPKCTQYPRMFFALSVLLIVPNVFDEDVNNIEP
jgi:hypothetical protein